MHNYKPSSMQWRHNCLKITLHHSVSVITNFVIPNRDKNRQKHHIFLFYSRRATHDPHHTWHGDRGGPCHFCTPSNFLIRSIVSPLRPLEHWVNAVPAGLRLQTQVIGLTIKQIWLWVCGEHRSNLIWQDFYIPLGCMKLQLLLHCLFT